MLLPANAIPCVATAMGTAGPEVLGQVDTATIVDSSFEFDSVLLDVDPFPYNDFDKASDIVFISVARRLPLVRYL